MTDAFTTQRKKVTLPADAVLDELIHDPSPEMLIAVAGDARLGEDLALSLLSRRDLPREALEELSRNSAIARLRKVRLALVMHPQTPRHVSVPTIRHLYVFELMQIALLPIVAADVKRAAEDVLINKLATISAGERFTLAKRSSGRVAAALLTDKEDRIVQAAPMNPQMTEAWIVRALKQESGTELLAPAVSRHQKWFHRNDIKAALLGNKNTPFARVVQIAADLPIQALRDVLSHGRIAPNVRTYLSGMMNKRMGRSS
jgi:hypothetical protein